MKKRILIMAALLFLAIMIPLTVNAATISAEPQNMEVGEEVTVTVKIDTADVESVQFDLKFDNTKYEYVIDSATSKLDSTRANLMAIDTVRVSAYNINGTDSTETVSLKFKAKNSGTSVPFTVLGGSLEVADATAKSATETFTSPSVTVAKITGKPTSPDYPYTNPDGSKIPAFDNTGDTNSRSVKKSIAGVYTTYTNLTGKIVPYALPTSDSVITIDDLKAEFGDTIDVSTITGTIVKTGDIFTINGEQHTVLIYGDVNQDGKVTTADAFLTRKYELGAITNLTDIQIEAFAVSSNTEQSILIQDFVLNLRYTKTGTILEAYPVEFVASDITVTPNPNNEPEYYRGEKYLVATISANNNRAISKELVSIAQPANVTIELVDNNNKVEVYATSNSSNSFDLVPVLTGNNIENGTITKDTQTIAPKDVLSASGVKILKDGKEITELSMLYNDETEYKFDLQYYHQYPNGDIEYLDENNSKFDSADVTLDIPQNNVLSTANTGLRTINNGVWNINNTDFINTLKVQSAKNNISQTVTLTVNVSNTNNASKYLSIKEPDPNSVTATLKVTIKTIEVSEIQINDKATTGSFELPLYEEMPSQSSFKVKEGINGEDGTYYSTIFDIKLLTNDSANPVSSLTNTNCAVLSQSNGTLINNLLNSTSSLVIKPNNLDAVTNVDYIVELLNSSYSPAGSGEEITAIGIACYGVDYHTTCMQTLKDGFTIYYGGSADIGGNVVKKELKIDIVEGTVTTQDDSSSNDGSNSFAPPVDHTENDMSTFSANVDVDAEDEKETEPTSNTSESPNTSETTTPDNTPTAPTTPEVNPTPEVPDTSKEPETTESVD